MTEELIAKRHIIIGRLIGTSHATGNEVVIRAADEAIKYITALTTQLAERDAELVRLRDESSKDFNRGVLIAVSTLINGWGEGTETRELLEMINADRAMVESMGFDTYDRDPLLKAVDAEAEHRNGEDPQGPHSTGGEVPVECTCVVAFGQDRGCPAHGEGTPWRAANPQADMRETPFANMERSSDDPR
ncbi:MAG: hypothetical protein CMN73_04170 [Sphingomonas sp.]|nr:hypothetical protein [Sphingomonas sp.]|tara:strand:- start:2312 stop:2878 length:567 start_codon:yes stop_codon:yes gene_type:complete